MQVIYKYAQRGTLIVVRGSLSTDFSFSFYSRVIHESQRAFVGQVLGYDLLKALYL